MGNVDNVDLNVDNWHEELKLGGSSLTVALSAKPDSKKRKEEDG
jgi:hypothetical protein